MKMKALVVSRAGDGAIENAGNEQADVAASLHVSHTELGAEVSETEAVAAARFAPRVEPFNEESAGLPGSGTASRARITAAHRCDAIPPPALR